MTNEQQRAAFEAWYDEYLRAPSQESTSYAYGVTHRAWSAWQAAIDQDRQSLGEPVCGRCNGSGESTRLVGGGPDAHDETCLCRDCTGTGNAQPAEQVKCDGDHGGPRCADPECWNDEPVKVPIVPYGWVLAPIEPAEPVAGPSDDMVVCIAGVRMKVNKFPPADVQAQQDAEPEWIDDPHDIEQGMMRNPKYKAQPDPAMAGDAVMPDCDEVVFKNGISVGLFDIPKEMAEALCKSLTAALGIKVDWHYFGGRVHIKALRVQPANGEDATKVLRGVVELAKVAHAHWDADRDMKVGKILSALAGWNEGYDRRADAMHVAMRERQP